MAQYPVCDYRGIFHVFLREESFQINISALHKQHTHPFHLCGFLYFYGIETVTVNHIFIMKEKQLMKGAAFMLLAATAIPPAHAQLKTNAGVQYLLSQSKDMSQDFLDLSNTYFFADMRLKSL